MGKKWGVEVTSLAVLLLVFALTGVGMAAEYSSMTSYEDLLRNQTQLIESFESLLKNSTLNSTMSYKFLISFDDLAARQQEGLYSFEDVVSFNWTELDSAQKINLTKSYEDLLRRQAVILTSNEDLLKRGFCQLPEDQRKDLLDDFEAKLKAEVVLLKKFEDWLHYQQMIEGTEYDTWMGFLASFEDLIWRQSNLLDSFEMMLKIDCSETYLNITKSADPLAVDAGQQVTYTYTITATSTYSLQNVVVKDSLWGELGTKALLVPGTPWILTVPKTLSCADCNNCMCKVCNFATVCGEVVTPNGNFTVCDVSNAVCVTVDEDFGGPIYPAPKTVEEPAPAALQPAAVTGKVSVEVTPAPIEQPKTTGCSLCGKK
jgi:uncharacterized repeat protein (TIGR01451 family)